MRTDDRFARNLSAWLAEDGAHRVPDHLAEVLVHSAATRQRPWWSSPERWLPVDTTLRPRLFDTPSAARLLTVGLLVLLAAAIALFAIGSQQHRLPPPFGLARNGTFIETRDGDIFTTDPTTSEKKLLLRGDGYDFSAIYSRDGTKFAFLRSDTGAPPTAPGDVMLTMFVANADGTEVRAITPVTKNLGWLEWSPDSTSVAYAADDRLYVVDVAGGAPRLISGTGPMFFPTWLPPDGKEIVYRAQGPQPALFAIRADGTGQRRLLSTRGAQDMADFSWPVVSADARWLAFTRWSRQGWPSVHAFDMTTGDMIDYPTNATGQQGAVFSPDGALIAYSLLSPDEDLQIAVARADGSGSERRIGPVVQGKASGAVQATWAFTPDGTALVVRFGDDARATTHLVPVDGSPSHEIETGAYQFIDVQRLAP